MLSFIAVSIKDQVVQNHKLLTSLNLDIYHLCRVLFDIRATLLTLGGRQLVLLLLLTGEVLTTSFLSMDVFAD